MQGRQHSVQPPSATASLHSLGLVELGSGQGEAHEQEGSEGAWEGGHRCGAVFAGVGGAAAASKGAWLSWAQKDSTRC